MAQDHFETPTPAPDRVEAVKAGGAADLDLQRAMALAPDSRALRRAFGAVIRPISFLLDWSAGRENKSRAEIVMLVLTRRGWPNGPRARKEGI